MVSSRGTATATDEVWRLPAALYALRPEATGKLDQVNQRAWEYVDPRWLELVRLRIAQLIGDSAGAQARSSAALRAGLSEDTIGELTAYPTAPRFGVAERAGLAFAEQFFMDVSGTTPESLAP